MGSERPAPERATKLVCTIGPASVDRLAELVDAGLDVARVNLSHGSREEQERSVRAVRDAASGSGRTVGLLVDLAGPKVRLGELEGGEAELEEGATFELRRDRGPGDARAASTNHDGLAEDLEPGDRVLLSDGAVELQVEQSSGGRVVTRILRGGTIRTRAGVNVPAERLSLPAISDKDERDAVWAVEQEVDLIAQSFVRRAEEIRALRSLLGDDPPLIVAKIETGPAVEDADGIIEAADVIMVARGDLGVELPLEQIPIVQRDLIAKARAAAVPVIVATEMLESMKESTRPTRAEVSDVAGAVFEGADAIMLSAESAIGKHPVAAARMATRIADAAGRSGYVAPPPELESPTDAHRVVQAAAAISRRGGVRAIACFTQSGSTARLLSATRPGVPIYAFSPDEHVARRMTILRGVTPFLAEAPADTDEMIAMADGRLRGAGVADEGDAVLMVGSVPFGEAHTNLVKVHRIGS